MFFYPNGKMVRYATDAGSTILSHGEWVITNKWIDSEGNIWYTLTKKRDYQNFWTYTLAQLSNFGKTVEFAESLMDYPKEISPNDPYTRYSIYYRQ